MYVILAVISTKAGCTKAYWTADQQQYQSHPTPGERWNFGGGKKLTIREPFRRRAFYGPPRDPWYQRRWSRRWNRIDGMGGDGQPIARARRDGRCSVAWWHRSCWDGRWAGQRSFRICDHRPPQIHQCNLFQPISLQTPSFSFLFARVRTVLLHNAQELDNDLGRRSDEDLSLASLLGIVDGVQAVVKDGGLDHFVGIWRIELKLRCEKKNCQVPCRNECPRWIQKAGSKVSYLGVVGGWLASETAVQCLTNSKGFCGKLWLWDFVM